jgi:hypothetical protein
MEGRIALKEAIASLPVPGAPARLSADGAAVGLSFLDTSLRLNHVRRLTERLTVIEHHAARRVTEVDVSLRFLDEGQMRAAELFRELRSQTSERTTSPALISRLQEVWVPVARISRRTVSPVDVFDAAGNKLPRLTQYENARLLASGLYRLFRGILSSHPAASKHSDLSTFLYKNNQPRWLIQSAILALLTERGRPRDRYKRDSTLGTVGGAEYQYRKIALDILDTYENTLRDYYSLLEVALNDYLLVVALDGGVNEHVLSYESPLDIDDEIPRRSLAQVWNARNRGYVVEYLGQIPSSLRSYHFVAETEPGVHITQMVLTTDSDRRSANEIRDDLNTLSLRLTSERQAPLGDPVSKLLELEAGAVLRRLSDLVRRRRWEASNAGILLADSVLPASSSLSWAATSGEGLSLDDGGVRDSILFHPEVTPMALADAGSEIVNLQLFYDLSIEDDPISNRAHAYWRRPGARILNSSQIKVRSVFVLRDATPSSPRGVAAYSLALSIMTAILWWFLGGHPWQIPNLHFDEPHSVGNADAVIAVLLLIPGFLYSRLALPDRQSVAGRLRKRPRFVAHVGIATMALLAAGVAAGVTGGFLAILLSLGVLVPAGAAAIFLSETVSESSRSLGYEAGAPRWALPASAIKPLPPGVASETVSPGVAPDARFYSSGARP